MTVKLLKRSDVVLGYFAQFLNLGVGIIVLPMALRMLNPEDLNFWLILNYVYTFSALMESSFSPNISRNITFVLSGVRKLSAWGFKEQDPGYKKDGIDWNLYRSLMKSINVIYLALAIFLLFFIGVLGTYLVVEKSGILQYRNIWFLYVGFISLGVYLGKYAAVTTGWGRVDVNNRALILSKLVYIFLSFLSLYFGYGIEGLVYSFVVQSFFARFVPIYFYRTVRVPENLNQEVEVNTLNVILPNSLRTMAVAISGFIITRGIVFIANANLPVEEVAPFTLSHQVVMVVCSVAVVFVQLAQAQIAKYSADKNRIQMIRNLVVSLRMMMGFMFLGAAVIFFAGADILTLLGSKTQLVAPQMILLLFVIGLLETNHSLFASFIMAKNEVPFVGPAIISALTIMVGAYWSIYQYKSIVFALFFQFAVQAAYNNWYWPKLYLNFLELPFQDFLRLMFKKTKE